MKDFQKGIIEGINNSYDYIIGRLKTDPEYVTVDNLERHRENMIFMAENIAENITMIDKKMQRCIDCGRTWPMDQKPDWQCPDIKIINEQIKDGLSPTKVGRTDPEKEIVEKIR